MDLSLLYGALNVIAPLRWPLLVALVALGIWIWTRQPERRDE